MPGLNPKLSQQKGKTVDQKSNGINNPGPDPVDKPTNHHCGEAVCPHVDRINTRQCGPCPIHL